MAPPPVPTTAHEAPIDQAPIDEALDGAGHGLYRDDWEMVVAAILEHTAAAERGRR